MNPEIYYLLGALRDGNFDAREGKNYELRMYQKDAQWLHFISEIISKNFGVEAKISKNLLRVNKRWFVEKLISISEYKCPQDLWNTPTIVANASEEEKWWYISGFWDAEGGVPYDYSPQKYVSFNQKSRSSLEFVRDFLVSQNFRPTNLTMTGKVWQFRITRRNQLKDFAYRIHSFHEKRRRLFKLAAALP